MNILAIDTSSKNLNIAFNLNGEVKGVFLKDCQLTHSEILMKTLDGLILENNFSLKDFDCFGCCVGPGSFTGIRIGVTTLRAFAQIFDKPVFSVNSCELQAYNECSKNHIISCIDAMQNKVYYAVYKSGKVILEPSLAELKDVGKIAAKYKGIIISDVEISGLKTLSPQSLNFKLGKLSAEKAGKNRTFSYKELQPLYVRLSSAEEKANFTPLWNENSNERGDI